MGTSAQRPWKHAHAFASIDAQSIIIVQAKFAGRGAAWAFATHACAWHGVLGAQSASVEHGSSLTTGAGRRHAPTTTPSSPASGLAVLGLELVAGSGARDDPHAIRSEPKEVTTAATNLMRRLIARWWAFDRMGRSTPDAADRAIMGA